MIRRSFGYGLEAKTSEWRHRDLLRQLGMGSETLWSDDLNRQAVARLDYQTGAEELSLTSTAQSA